MAEQDTGSATPRTYDCATCGELGAVVYATEKVGWPEHSAALPDAASKLETVREISRGGGRCKAVRRCPTCGDYFFYELDYEFLAGGSEDDESLRRLTVEQAEALL